MQDAVVFALRVWHDYDRQRLACTFDAWIRQRVWGMLKDKYAIPIRRDMESRKNAESIRLNTSLRSPDPTDLTLPDPIEQEQIRIDVEDAIAKLPAGEAALVRAVYFEGKTQDELAREHGVGQSAISRRIRRARRQLADLLRAYESD